MRQSDLIDLNLNLNPLNPTLSIVTRSQSLIVFIGGGGNSKVKLMWVGGGGIR